MLLKTLQLASIGCFLFATQAFAGIGLHYSGVPASGPGEDFNFAVSSTTVAPHMVDHGDPSEPSTPFFNVFLQLRDFSVSYKPGRMPMLGGGAGGGGFGGNFRGGSFSGIIATNSPKRGKRTTSFGLPGVGGGGFGAGSSGYGFQVIEGDEQGYGPGVDGGGTTSPGQTVSGTHGIVCITNTNPGGDDHGHHGHEGGGEGGGPEPTAVPEPSAIAIWSLIAGTLIFGTRRMASI
ncbi:MAG: hypothetical protein KDB27_34905 [Planctomycetales bacterium]|nr:hypothetical protein [Planctomycetales bacterium]